MQGGARAPGAPLVPPPMQDISCIINLLTSFMQWSLSKSVSAGWTTFQILNQILGKG